MLRRIVRDLITNAYAWLIRNDGGGPGWKELLRYAAFGVLGCFIVSSIVIAAVAAIFLYLTIR